MESKPEIVHTVEIAVDAILKECVFICACGHEARGDNWEQAGIEIDTHFDDVREP